MEDVLPKLDVLYMTRVQKERFFNEDDYIRMKDFYILDQSKNGSCFSGNAGSASAAACQ